MLSPAGASLAATFPEFVDPNPAPGNQFGATVVALSTGNVVITSPFDDAGGTDAGAVYLFNGATGALISTCAAPTADDHGRRRQWRDRRSRTATSWSAARDWDNGGVVNAGAVTWGSGTTGVSGVISAANSLVGSTANDQVGGIGRRPRSRTATTWSAAPSWDNGASSTRAR